MRTNCRKKWLRRFAVCARAVRNELYAAFLTLAVPAYVPYDAAFKARGAVPRRAAEVQTTNGSSGMSYDLTAGLELIAG